MKREILPIGTICELDNSKIIMIIGYKNISIDNKNISIKDYVGVKYPEGEYESLVITLGEGKGDNWWCVLFPPLCLVEAEEHTDVEYKFFVKEIIDKYM